MDGRIKSGKVIRAGDENILHTTVPQAVKHGRPELGALIFAYPTCQVHLPAIQINAYGKYTPLSLRSAPRCGHGSGWHPKIPRRRWTPKAAAATLWPQAGSCP